MISFEMKTETAVIKNINNRLEKYGEDKTVAIDLDISAEVSSDIVAALAIDGNGSELMDSLYDDEGMVKPLGVSKIVFDREYEEHTIRIEVPSVNDDNCIRISDVKLKKFTVAPLYGKLASLGLQVQCKPDDEQLVFLSHAITKNSLIVWIIKPEQMDMLDNGEEEQSEE